MLSASWRQLQACSLCSFKVETHTIRGPVGKDLKLFDNFARQFPEKNVEEARGDSGDLTLDTFNIPMNAISVPVRRRMFSKNGGALPKVLCTQMAESLAFKP